MSVTIRLARFGRKNLPAFRIVVANTRSKRNGMFLDTIGSYNPTEKPEVFKYDKDKFKMWKERGALVTASVTELVEGKYKFIPYPSAKKLKREQKKMEQKLGEEKSAELTPPKAKEKSPAPEATKEEAKA